MRKHPSILPIRPLVSNPVRLGRRRRLLLVDGPARAGVTRRHHALADASRPAWLSAPLFSRHQPPSPAVARHAA